MRVPLFSVHTKPIEWMMAFMMLSWAITLSMPGGTLSLSAYVMFSKVGISENGLLTFYLTMSIIRIAVLWRNGKFSRGPEVRFVCSAVGAFTWLTSGLLFVLPYMNGDLHALPAQAGNHIVFFFGEIYSVGVASVDRRIKLG